MNNYFETYSDKYGVIINKYKKLHPYLSNTKLAEHILELEHLDTTVDVLRKMIPYVINKTIEPSYTFDKSELELPESWYQEQVIYELPKVANDILLLSDIHIPFHDVPALSASIKYGLNNPVNCIILNGDIADFYACSVFSRLPKYRNVKKEIDCLKDFLKILRNNYKYIPIYYKLGNHEYRYIRYLMEKAPELFEIEDFDIANLLNLKELGIELIENKRLIKAGKLYIAHGDEFYAGRGMINIARQIRLKSSENVIFGHFHKTQEDVTTTISNKIIGSWSIGCLCGLRPEWLPISFWNHGFAHIQVESDGIFTVINHKIINGVVK
jgi:predicted phosphodiesterase